MIQRTQFPGITRNIVSLYHYSFKTELFKPVRNVELELFLNALWLKGKLNNYSISGVIAGRMRQNTMQSLPTLAWL